MKTTSTSTLFTRTESVKASVLTATTQGILDVPSSMEVPRTA
jgi:hypothetical protein